jgi:hypothetical protein
VGGAVGLAVLATVASERTDGLLADGEPAASALNSGFHLAFLIGAICVVAAVAVALAVIESEPAIAEGEHEDERPPSGEPAYSEAA